MSAEVGGEYRNYNSDWAWLTFMQIANETADRETEGANNAVLAYRLISTKLHIYFRCNG